MLCTPFSKLTHFSKRYERWHNRKNKTAVEILIDWDLWTRKAGKADRNAKRWALTIAEKQNVPRPILCAKILLLCQVKKAWTVSNWQWKENDFYFILLYLSALPLVSYFLLAGLKLMLLLFPWNTHLFTLDLIQSLFAWRNMVPVPPRIGFIFLFLFFLLYAVNKNIDTVFRFWVKVKA